MLRQRHTDAKSKGKKPPRVVVSPPPSKTSSGKSLFSIVISVIIIIYFIVPISVYLCPSIRRHVVFLHYISLSRNKNLTLPTDYGLNCTKNFYISSDEGITLGAWHIPALEALSRCEGDSIQKGKEFSDTRPVFLYLHGNAGTRGGGHRVHLYKVLSQKVNSHVIAIDYRGYADSSNVDPSQGGVVNDSINAYHWLRQHVEMNRIYIWGHSLGTGIATAVLKELLQKNEVPAGVILEAPFTKLMDAVKYHPLSFFHRYMPFFDFFITDPIANETNLFNSITRMGHIKSPLLILHAEDDGFIPFNQGKQLYERALAERSTKVYLPQFVGFDRKLGYGHKDIYKDPTLPDIIKRYTENTNTHSTNT